MTVQRQRLYTTLLLIQSQHDKLQHFFLVTIPTDITTFMSGTSNILHILYYLITLFFFLEID